MVRGFLFLSMLGALAEWNSRNLATETKKGWAERKRYVLNAGAAWDDADDTQHNRLVRALFESVLVKDRHLAAVRLAAVRPRA